MLFLTSQFVNQGFTVPFRLDRTNTGGGTLVYVRDDITSKLLNISYVSSDTECLAIEVNVLKAKWFLICSYDKYLCIDFNSETPETVL